MSHTINLTVKLKLQLESELEQDAFFSNLSHLFQSGLGERLLSDADAIEVIALQDPEGTLTRQPYLETMLEDFDAAASLWDIDDVLEICPSLSRADALSVLESVTNPWDGYSGIQPCTFTDAIEGVLGIDPKTGLPLDNHSN